MRKHKTAADIMQRDVVTVGPHDNLREAMSLMIDNHISGLPVLDRGDRCVGVVSATDILNLEFQQAERADDDVDATVGSYFNPDTQRWENLRMAGSLDELPDVEVGEVMSRELLSVAPGAPLSKVAAMMAEHEVHRILVVDGEKRLHGIVSSLDFVRLYSEEA
jgi:CBS domain-containing protein